MGAVTLTAGYGYTNGNLTSLTTPSGQAVVYAYNTTHQITSITVNGTTLLSSAAYDTFGPLKGWTWSNPDLERHVLLVETRALGALLRELTGSDVRFEHVYDY